MEEVVHELRQRITGEVRFDSYSRALYSTDASIYEIEPMGVVIPRHADDMQATVEVASRHAIPIVPRGAGTSIVGNAIGPGIIMDCSKYLNKTIEINREEGWARIEPGVVLDQLNQQLKPFNLLFGPDVATSSRATLGGMMGNNSSGAHSLVYGKTIDHVLELKVLLSNGEFTDFTSQTDGAWRNRFDKSGFANAIYSRIDELVRANRQEIERRFPKILRRVAGYNLDEFVRQNHNNLAKLIVGSEGTLAVITEAKINLVPLPKFRVLAIVHFSDLFDALQAVGGILEFKPYAVELLDNNIIDLTRATQEYARRLTFVNGFPAALLLVEFHGDSKPELLDKVDKLAQYLSRNHIGYDCSKLIEPAEQVNVWYIRKAGLGLLMGTKADRKPVGFIEDSAVAPEKLPAYIRRFDEIVRAYGTNAAYYAHASVGCLHIRPKLDLKDSGDVEIMGKMAADISSLALEFGGTISGEHGDGLSHSCWNEKMFGPQLYAAFREVKSAFDPKNILNPGKIVDAQFLTENLRKAPKPEIQPILPFFDYSRDGGFHNTIELCNGNGVCRKLGEGTMCPSYMVTMEEEHSTRGRANALRAVLTGKLDSKEFTSRRMYEVLELCLACKGCKGECPTNVDMAKLKYEFLYQYHKAHGLPIRDRLFGHIATINRIGSAVAPLSNWVVNTLPARWLLESFGGISRFRKLPPFASPTFQQWFRNRPLRNGGLKNKVALFNDTFMNYNYPEIGRAAVKILEAAGFEVLLPEKKCCGRPFLSKGMLEEARACAKYNVEKLFPLVEQGVPIVGCEPSCMMTFRDEYPDLLNDPRVAALSENTFLVEEFLPGEATIPLSIAPAQKKFLLHGHCHLKALAGTAPTVNFLKRIPGAEVEIVDSGCCGMAGSFGFEKEHYLISIAMGRRRLFEAVESKDDEWEIVAPGVSCRQQIEHGTGLIAKHPVEVLAENLTF
ncbi:MAG TPA: anaerobic glycerol-3-phosphate dehydrogenase subunit C [bacterium]